MPSEQALDQSYLKRYNIERMLTVLERCQPVSRTDLARITEMSSASVTRIVNALTTLGLVREVSVTSAAGRGRKAINLSTVPEGMFTLGCHIDLRSLRLCLLDFSSKSRATAETAIGLDDLNPARITAIVREQLLRLGPPSLSKVRCLGVSLSGRVDEPTGRILDSRAFGWHDVDLVGPLSQALSLPVVVENDVKACLTWERDSRGPAPEVQDTAYLYLGRTGIGFANTVGGQLVRGQSNSAGEIEDISLGLNERLGGHLMEESLVASARRVAPSVQNMGDIIAAHKMGLPWARMLMDDFFSHLNIVLQLIRAVLDPHRIILGGDIPDALRENQLLPPTTEYELGARFEESCALGAAAIARQRALHTLIEGTLDG